MATNTDMEHEVEELIGQVETVTATSRQQVKVFL